ncbi:phosphoribosylglycinamide formyltransferase [Conexibacter sp. DBS9H8]|uniref:phosphoribosylglycinamide formyltransferase n=1 Tax=Conexibacter sp. DBS9H8 TaxID=2937801 RepID=UPI00200D18B4|nr:phosphoribosylglycinamide formyltransferase [Conexibacter sp. DBS9H8]
MNVAVLASGAGTNLQALIDQLHGRDGLAIVAVASDRPEAPALARAAAAGIPSRVFPRAEHGGDRAARDRAMAGWLTEAGAELVVLAGYMQLVSPAFLGAFPDRVINVHPALLPAFPGLDAVGQALDYGVKVFGVTVHLVDAGVDSGAILLQQTVALPEARTRAEVQAALAPIEHALLPAAVRAFADGRVRRDPAHPRRVVLEQ